MAAIYSNGGNRWNILGFNFTKRDALSSVYKISMLISNKLTLNRKKSEYMFIGSQERLDKILETPKILYGEHQIKGVREKTVLGLIIDDLLEWNRHNDEQCKKISKSNA
jgi:hypothetical protein